MMIDKPEMVTTTIRLTKEQLDWVRETAFKARQSMSSLFRDLLDDKMFGEDGGEPNAD
jgi:hypothetical protein